MLNQRWTLARSSLEVDDLFIVGHEERRAKMAIFHEKYVFGKRAMLKPEPEGVALNGPRIKQLLDGEFQVNMEKVMLERLNEVGLEKGRKSDKKAKAAESEGAKARATCGSLNWLSKELRPDAAGPSSLLLAKLARLTVEDIVHMNYVVKGPKARASLKVRVRPLKNMRLSSVTDASFASNGYHSQGGQIVVARESKLRDDVPAETNVFVWRNGKLQRVVNSIWPKRRACLEG